jgi:hypothetical protein
MGVGRLLFSLFKMPRRASKFRITEELVRVVEPIGQRIVPSTLLGRNFAKSLPLGPPIPVSGPTSATRSELQIFPKRIAAACVSGLRPQQRRYSSRCVHTISNGLRNSPPNSSRAAASRHRSIWSPSVRTARSASRIIATTAAKKCQRLALCLPSDVRHHRAARPRRRLS